MSTSTIRSLAFSQGWRDVTVRPSDNPDTILYYADISEFKRKMPDVTLHSESEDGPIVARARYRYSRDIKAALGDDDTKGPFFDLKCEYDGSAGCFGCKHRHYTVEYGSQQYIIRRTKEIENHKSSWNKRHFTIHNDRGELIAAWISAGTFNKRGTMEFYKQVDKEMESLLVLVIVSWRDKLRRQAAAAGTAGSSAGSFAAVY